MDAQRDDGFRRALSLAPSGAQMALDALTRAAQTASSGARGAGVVLGACVRGAGSSAMFVTRNVLSPLSSFAFGSATSSSGTVRFASSKAACPPFLLGKHHHTTRSEQQIRLASAKLRRGDVKCSIRGTSDSAPTEAPALALEFATSPHTSKLASRAAPLRTTRRFAAAAQAEQAVLIAHLWSVPQPEQLALPGPASAAVASAVGSDSGAVVEWGVNALGLQSSML